MAGAEAAAHAALARYSKTQGGGGIEWFYVDAQQADVFYNIFDRAVAPYTYR